MYSGSVRYIASDSQVCISTIQRLYSILKGEELDDIENENRAERGWQPKQPLPVVYNSQIPIETFDFVVIDECHRSIYNVWQQVWIILMLFLSADCNPDSGRLGFST
jgi:type I restriction enzyme R subunit